MLSQSCNWCWLVPPVLWKNHCSACACCGFVAPAAWFAVDMLTVKWALVGIVSVYCETVDHSNAAAVVVACCSIGSKNCLELR